MQKPGTLILSTGFLFALSLALLSGSPSPLSHVNPEASLPDFIDDVYQHFDSLRTDLSDYGWPTNASKTMSSAFAEFRKTHFHAGIDISTNGRKGYAVYASRSGYVARILVSPVGYGKMLQVRHADGFTTVYAHLQRFTAEIEQYVRQKQYEAERYGVDLKPDPDQFPVEKGSVIAYTGDTGVGPPHLHFEIRDERNNPVNPLLAPAIGEIVKDTRPPEFLQVSFAPYSHLGRINGSPLPLLIELRHRGNQQFEIPGTVRLSGPVGLSVKAVDRVNATWHRNGVYQYELYLDGTLIFTSKLDRFSAKESEQIALHYDWPLVVSGEGRFQKLYLEPGNRLPLYSQQPEKSGILSDEYGPGQHDLLVVARDIKGNEARLSATVLFEEPPSFEVLRVNNTYVLLPSFRQDLESITIASQFPGSKRWKQRRLDASQLASTEQGTILPVEERGQSVIRILGTHADGSVTPPVYFAPPANSKQTDNSLSIRTEFLRDYVLITVSSHLPFSLRPTVWLADGQTKALVDLTALDERTYAGTFPLRELSAGTVRVDARGSVNGADVESYREFLLFPITPHEGGTIVAGGGDFVADFQPGGVYQPMFCRVEQTSDGYRLLPGDVLLSRGATVRYRIPPGFHPERSGLFYHHDGDLELLSTAAEDGYLSGKVSRFLGEFEVRQDTIPPVISNISIRYSKGILNLSLRIRDFPAGVDEDNLRITVDGRLIIGEYDPYRRRVEFVEPYRLDEGIHVLEIQAGDRLGNSSTAVRTFRTF